MTFCDKIKSVCMCVRERQRQTETENSNSCSVTYTPTSIYKMYNSVELIGNQNLIDARASVKSNSSVTHNG